ncbi:HNH/ENDO VII family nuclease [Adlercreutzia sp. ZJ138]|uniref:HNH/ENDO VII family nuclease n=1 Tax=Adlercreutzia sp. ZJ138 TaxID=2709405 RepID=UPI0013EA9CEE|nr:HNH/ENDO VII family nuclease [Adlercreutzia sp. ZJ138]
MIWKRFVATAVTVAMVALLSGCGSKATSETQTQTQTQTSTIEFADKAAIDSFTSLSDPALLRYVEDTVYDDLVGELDSDKYLVENVEAVFVSQEYIDELAYNSQENIFFGYTLSELDQQFQGKRYIFTTDDSGNTTVKEFEAYDDTYDQAIRNVAIGSGVILVCVTVSVVSGGAALPAVSTVFATAAKAGTIGAVSGGLIGGVSAGAVTGIQTGDMDQALKSAALGASEGFKWGAISGALTGGASEAMALKGATLNGLTMNEAAAIQKESKYPLDVIKQFHGTEEYNVFKNAGLKPTMVDGKSMLTREIELALKDDKGRTNLERMKQGLAPLTKNGETIELHHVGQNADGTLAMLTTSEHDNPALHGFLAEGAEGVQAQLGSAWDKQRQAIWKAFAAKIGG